jgi:hypothetical protein
MASVSGSLPVLIGIEPLEGRFSSSVPRTGIDEFDALFFRQRMAPEKDVVQPPKEIFLLAGGAKAIGQLMKKKIGN